MEDHDDAIYRKVETMVLPILESNAKRFSRQLGMTYPEALQEGRFGLMIALRKYNYNDSRGGIYNFVKTSVRRHFLKCWALQKTQARRPHVQITTEDGKRMSLPMPFVDHAGLIGPNGLITTHGHGSTVPGDFMDTLEAPMCPAPDAALLDEDASAAVTEFQVALENALSDRDRQVLRCKHDPPRGLKMLMLDELLEEPTIPLIGRYLGLSKNEVDWAIRRIREAAIDLIGRDFIDLTDFAIVRAHRG